MRAIILAAGRGSRLCDITNDKPKCMVELNGRTLLDWQISSLQKAGINEIGIVTGYLSEKINFNGLRYFKNELWQSTNMVMSLLCAKEWLENDECIVSYADIVYPGSTVQRLMKSKEGIVITYNTKWFEYWVQRFEDPLSDAETFKIDDKGYLLEIGKKTKSVHDIMGQYMGLLKFTTNGWNAINSYLDDQSYEKKSKMDMTSLLNELLRNGKKIFTVPVNGNWFEIDNKSDLELCSVLLGKSNNSFTQLRDN